MEVETIIVANREYTCHKMNAFAANKLLLRLQKVVLPVIGSALGDGKGIGDVDVAAAATMISEHLDEATIDTIVLPMFSDSRLYDVEKKRFIRSSSDIDMCFSADTLIDFYELIFEVGKVQFASFFGKLADRFGGLIAEAKLPESPGSSTKI